MKWHGSISLFFFKTSSKRNSPQSCSSQPPTPASAGHLSTTSINLERNEWLHLTSAGAAGELPSTQIQQEWAASRKGGTTDTWGAHGYKPSASSSGRTWETCSFHGLELTGLAGHDFPASGHQHPANHRLIPAGKELRKSLVQPQAQCRVSSGIQLH